VHRGDVRMLQAGLYLDLAQQGALDLRIRRYAARQKLDRFHAAREDMLGREHLARGAGADPPDETIVTGRCARFANQRVLLQRPARYARTSARARREWLASPAWRAPRLARPRTPGRRHNAAPGPSPAPSERPGPGRPRPALAESRARAPASART